MGTAYPDLFNALAAPFGAKEVKQKPGKGGRTEHFVSARTVMNRLDMVLGPEAWHDEYIPREHSVICKLSIRLPDGSWITKSDAGGYAGMADQGDDEKSGYSDAFKRAAIKFGVGRHLYGDGVPVFAKAEPTAGPGPGATATWPQFLLEMFQREKDAFRKARDSGGLSGVQAAGAPNRVAIDEHMVDFCVHQGWMSWPKGDSSASDLAQMVADQYNRVGREDKGRMRDEATEFVRDRFNRCLAEMAAKVPGDAYEGAPA